MAKSMPKGLTKEEFVAKARQVHGDCYDYTTTVYSNTRNKIEIRCRQHGFFTQLPLNHIKKKCGCPKCGAIKISAALRGTSARFIQNAKSVHGELYDYRAVEYINNSSNVTILCHCHGFFKQSPANHIKGQGCPICGNQRRITTRTTPQESFVEKAKLVHDYKYDYTQASYYNNKTRLTIICPNHGAFAQVAADHLSGKGCQLCGRHRISKSVLQRNALNWIELANGRIATLYLVRFFSAEEQFYKVGVTYETVEMRYRARKCLSRYHVEIIAQYRSANARAIYEWEQSIIITFAHLRYRPKQRFAGVTECFSSVDEILQCFPL